MEEFVTTRAAVKAFLRRESRAHTLQAALERYRARADVHTWLDEFWADRYLGRRDSIAVNANFFCLLGDSGQGQLERAARLIAAAVSYKLLLDAQLIQPVVQRGRVLSMEQNKFLFSTTRIPGAVRDTVRSPYSAEWPGPSRERHVVVMYRGAMIRMEVIGADGRPYAVPDLVAGLRAVMALGPSARGPSVGNLTTKARAEWAKSRRALLDCDPRNADMLDVVERALLCICLEDTAPRDALAACDQLLHGDSGNRWFDKSFSLVVFADGTAGLNVEHSRLDGTTVANVIDAICGPIVEEHVRRSVSVGVPAVEPIEFALDAEVCADVRAAAAAFAQRAADTASAVLSLGDVGANLAKQLGVSPDAFWQMAFQRAHHRTRGVVGATYESISTRHFHHGRTEAMRVVTPEVVHFLAIMDDPAADDRVRTAALRAAADAHARRTKECQAGNAPEQHLWELQLIHQSGGDGSAVHGQLALYQTPGWSVMRDDYLSTSSTASVNVRYFGFGPTTGRCIGIAYLMLPDRTNLYLSAPRAVSQELHRFTDGLSRVVKELRELLSGG